MPDRDTSEAADQRNEEVLQKLDLKLYRLLRMSDQEIVQAVQQQVIRAEAELHEIERLADGLLIRGAEDRRAVARVQELRRAALQPHPGLEGVTVDPSKVASVKAEVLVLFTGNRQDLTTLGLEVKAQAHDVFVVQGTIQQLTALAQQPSLLRMEQPHRLPPGVDGAARQAEVYTVHQKRATNPTGYKGDGIIVGIIDSALDVSHNAFRDPSGSHGTRVLYYWVTQPDSASAPGQDPDQFSKSNAGAPDFSGLKGGRLYSQDDINKALSNKKGIYGDGPNQISCTPKSDTEHGTFVAGVAVGSGHEDDWTPGKYVGAAPKAGIVHVSAETDSEILNGLKLVFAVADKEKKPAVVNISLGGHSGPHLGTENLDRAIDSLLNSYDERMVVGITQNWDHEHGVRHGSFGPADVETILLTPKKSSFDFNLYYSGDVVEFQVEVEGASSGDWRKVGNLYSEKVGDVDFWIADAPVREANLRAFQVNVSDADYDVPVKLRLRSTSKVTYTAWVGVSPDYAEISGATHGKWTLCGLGCCKAMLTVGATDELQAPNPKSMEPVTYYSGSGPTLDGRVKPEIVAVGGSMNPKDSNTYILIHSANSDKKSGYSFGKFGTSFAAPLVAGSSALIFQEARQLSKPRTLNSDTVKALLTQNAKIDYKKDDINRYGYGRMRLIAPIDHLRGPVKVDLWVRTAEDDYGEEPFPGTYFWGSPDIKVFRKGTTEEIYELNWGTPYDVRITIRNLGTDPAVDAKVSLKYALPHTAPSQWHPAIDAGGKKEHSVEVPALGVENVEFEWTPKRIQNAPAGTTHFCLLAVAEHDLDKHRKLTETDDAWATNIKGENNIALRNVIIL
jgi:hypothetical protein